MPYYELTPELLHIAFAAVLCGAIGVGIARLIVYAFSTKDADWVPWYGTKEQWKDDER